MRSGAKTAQVCGSSSREIADEEVSETAGRSAAPRGTDASGSYSGWSSARPIGRDDTARVPGDVGPALKSQHMGVSTYSRGVVGARPAVVCAICGRTVLVGERTFRFTPDGREFVDVCPLCKDEALAHGWVSEGGPSVPLQPGDRQSRGLISKLLGKRPPPVEPMPEPILRKLSRNEQQIVEAATLFNLSPHRRTVE